MTTKSLQAQLNAARDKMASDIAGDLGDNGCCFHTAKLASTRTHNSLAPLVIELATALQIIKDSNHGKDCDLIADKVAGLAIQKLEAYLNGGGK